MLDKKYFKTSIKVLKDGVNTYKSIYLENNMVGTMEQKISFGALQILLDDMNAEYDAKWKLECVRGFNFFPSMAPKQSILVQSRKGVS